MSPEQAQGKKVDPRSDIFSLGVVLYEMVTGVRAFGGESALSTLSSILRDEARPMVEIAPDVPAQLEQVIGRCLRKNPDDRFQSMKEVQAALGTLKHESDSGMLYRARVGLDPLPSSLAKPATSSVAPLPAPPAPGSRTALMAGIGAAAAVVVLAGVGGWWWMKHRVVVPPTPPPVAAVVTPVPAPPPPPVAETPPPSPPAPTDQALTNDSVLQLLEGKVATGTILSQIRNAPKTNFNLSIQEVVRLTKAGATEEVIETMRNPKKAPTRATPAPPVTVASAPVAPPTPSPAPAAPAPVASAPAPSAAPVTQTITLEDGFPIPITLAEDIPDSADAGRPIRFTVTDAIRADGAILIAKGAAVSGEIVDGSKKKLFGGTKMTFRLLVVEAADGHKYRVRPISARGDAKNQLPVETKVKPKSKDLVASAGTGYIAYIDGDVSITVHK
jgi:serine/threonine-protein kinase